MKKIIAYFIKYPISADVLVILLVIFGLFGANSMRSTLLPGGRDQTAFGAGGLPRGFSRRSRRRSYPKD